MKDDEQRSIFRIEAIRRYAQGDDTAVLPQFFSPRIMSYLWAMIGFILAGGLLLWLMRIPVYASAIAIPISAEYARSYVSPRVSVSGADGELLMAVFLPSRDLARLRVGQSVFWVFSKSDQRIVRVILESSFEVSSPDSLPRKFGLKGRAATAIAEPVVVAFAKLEPVPDRLPEAAYLGGVYHADVEIGNRRVISLLPLIGRFFED